MARVRAGARVKPKARMMVRVAAVYYSRGRGRVSGNDESKIE